jgi:hypothetical protein
VGLIAVFEGSYPVSATYTQPGVGAEPVLGRSSICGILRADKSYGMLKIPNTNVLSHKSDRVEEGKWKWKMKCSGSRLCAICALVPEALKELSQAASDASLQYNVTRPTQTRAQTQVTL